MKIITLVENTTCREDLACEHGLSVYLETDRHKILFDAGQTDAFWENARKMGVDLTAVDMVILSHGHYDHGGGLAKMLEENKKALVYINRRAFGAYYNGTEKYIGLPSQLRHDPRVILTDGDVTLDCAVTILGSHNRKPAAPVDSYGLTVKTDAGFASDSFDHEQYLLLQEGNKRILFSGCSHKGICNIMDWFAPDILVGGFHFMKLDADGAGKQQLCAAARRLLEYDTVYYTGHCTGEKQYDYLKTLMGDRLHSLSTGSVIELAV